MRRHRSGVWALLLPLLFAGPVRADGVAEPGWQDVSRIFALRCINCHSALGAARGLRLDSYTNALAGSERGQVLIAGDAAGSEMVQRLRGERTPRMPFLSVPLPEDEIGLIIRWIEAGLPEAPPDGGD